MKHPFEQRIALMPFVVGDVLAVGDNADDGEDQSGSDKTASQRNVGDRVLDRHVHLDSDAGGCGRRGDPTLPINGGARRCEQKKRPRLRAALRFQEVCRERRAFARHAQLTARTSFRAPAGTCTGASIGTSTSVHASLSCSTMAANSVWRACPPRCATR